MSSKTSGFAGLRSDESGAAAIEYVILACVMGLMLIPTVAYLSNTLQNSYDRLLGWF